MTIATKDVVEVTQSVCSSLLGEDTPVVVIEQEAAPGDENVIAGVIIDGEWRGAVEVHVSAGLALRLAREVFQVEAETDSDDVRDIVGEVANMIGGNLKGLLPHTCTLSIPRAGPISQHDARTAIDRRFAIGEDGLVVIVKHFNEVNGEAA